jgi:hypothetical protein
VNSQRTYNELKAQFGDPPSGPLNIEDYEVPPEDGSHPERLGIRPGLFLGWRYIARLGHYYGPSPDNPQGQPIQDYWTGKTCYYDLYAAFAHWNELLNFYWMLENQSFLQAYNNATIDAASAGSYPPWDVLEPVHKKWNNSTHVWDYTTFHPDTCLDIAGYGGMHFNERNHGSDTW